MAKQKYTFPGLNCPQYPFHQTVGTIEVDDGLKPYYFYCLNWFAAVPLHIFDRAKTQKAQKTGGGQP